MQFPSSSKTKGKSSRETEDDVMELYVWGPAFGLPSVDSESIQAMACIRFGGAPVKIFECNNPWKSNQATMPFFKHGNKTLYSSEEISTYLRQKNYSCDYGLTSKQGAEIIAYAKLIEDCLQPALQYYSFVHEVNFLETTRPAYGTLLPWLYKMWYAERRLKQKAHKLIEAIYREAEFDPEGFEPEILIKAQNCIKILSDKLGTNDFFVHPNSPTTLDAFIYSYLASFVKIPWQHSPVKEYIKSTPNLERYVARISNKYFSAGPGPGGDNSKTTRNSSKKDYISSNSSEEPLSENPLVHKIMGFLVATAALMLYAYTNGMFRYKHSLRFPMEEEEEWDE